MKSTTCTFLVLLSVSSPALSTPITFNFSGGVWNILDSENHLEGLGISIDSSFSGSFTYDPLAEAKLLVSDYANYRAGKLNVSLGGTYHYEALPVGDFPSIQLMNDRPTSWGTATDSFNYLAADGVGSLGQNTISRFDTSLAFEWFSLQILLSDVTNSAFSSLALPSDLILDNFQGATFTIAAGSYGGSSYRIHGNITQLSLSEEIPVPATLFLVILGLLGIYGRKLLYRSTSFGPR